MRPLNIFTPFLALGPALLSWTRAAPIYVTDPNGADIRVGPSGTVLAGPEESGIPQPYISLGLNETVIAGEGTTVPYSKQPPASTMSNTSSQ
jgi:hypothetical protein